MFGPSLLYLFLAVGLAVHAMRTGRSQWWLFILFFPTWTIFPWWLACHIAIELIPALFQTRGARKVRSGIGAVIDPDKELRERVAQAGLVDLVDAKRALAEECEKRGQWQEAIRLYQAAATGIFADDPAGAAGARPLATWRRRCAGMP